MFQVIWQVLTNQSAFFQSTKFVYGIDSSKTGSFPWQVSILC